MFITLIHSWDTVHFWIPWPDWPHPFLTISTQKLLDQLLIYANLYQHTTRSPGTTSLFLLLKPFMMNMQNQGSKENLGVKLREGICTKLCLKLWFESSWAFCNINNSEWLWKRLSRKKVLNNHFLKSLQKQLYADVLQNRCS